MIQSNIPLNSWGVKESDFPLRSDLAEKISFLLRYSLLAPSSHNTQPWKFRIEGNVAYFLPNLEVALSYSDRAQRQMFISIGCALANFLVAASHFGFSTRVELLPEEMIDDIGAKVSIGNGVANKRLKSLFPFITKRVTNRFPYLSKEIPLEICKDMTGFVDSSRIKVDLIVDTQKKNEIITLLEETSKEVFSDQIFKDELANWMRSVYTKAFDGIPLHDFGVPRPITVPLVKLFKYLPAWINSRHDKKLFGSAPCFMVISSKFDNRESWIEVGKYFEFMALEATKHSLFIAPWAGLVEHPVAKLKFRNLLKSDNYPLFFARIGYANSVPPHSPRRSIEETLAQ